MQQTYVVTGVLSDPRTVNLDEPLPAVSGKVRLVVQVLAPSPPDLQTFMAKMWEEQGTRGHIPPSKEEVDNYLKAERESWDF